MKRHLLACAFFALATAALCAQQPSQSNPSDPYSGTSNPPPDDTIQTAAPQQPPSASAKPHPGTPMYAQPAAPAQPTQSAPQAQQPAAQNPPAVSDPNAGTDAGIVQPDQPGPQPSLTTRSAASDPDGDIVHPAPLPPGVIGEGATIRVHLLDRISTIDSTQGDAFRATVASDVAEGGQVLIPAGSQIEGHIVEVSKGHLGGRGSMRLRPEIVTLPNGQRFQLAAYVAGAPGAHARIDREGNIGAEARVKRGAIEYGGAMGVGAIAGAAMGGGAGALAGTLIGAGAVTLHLLLSHPQATLEPGSVLLFTLTQPLDLVPNPTSAANQAPAAQQ